MTAAPVHRSADHSDRTILVPRVDGDWWTIAGNPDLGRYNREGQQPLDFTIWRAADGRWQMAACCRRTGCGGKGRIFHRWQSESLDAEGWEPMGILLEADPNIGETAGGLQAPSVIGHDGGFFMFYGDWVNLRMAWSADGKTFSRQIGPIGHNRLFPVGAGSSNRDPHVMAFQGRFFLYYTGVTNNSGAIYCRVSDDLHSWSEPIIANSGGSGGSGPSDAECPFVLYQPDQRAFYLFRAHTRKDGDGYETSVFLSTDPRAFGVDGDECKISSLPLEAIHLIEYEGRQYLAALKPDLTGMMMARLSWVPQRSVRSEDS